jgi:4-amino-4-deoxychorismate lyase
MTGALGIWVDGARTSQVPADDRGLHYGDGLFETVIVRRRVPRFLDAHLARLAQGCARLGIAGDFLAGLRDEIRDIVADAPDPAVLKILVTRGSATRRGYAPLGDERPRRILSLWPGSAPSASWADGVELVVANARLADNPGLAGLKHLSRLENVMATREAEQAGAFDALMLHASGHVISGAMSNVFAWSRGKLRTPRVDRAGVAGILRSVLLREAPALGLVALECELTLAELIHSDEVFITNVRIGVVPVRRVGEHRFPMNAIAQRLASHIGGLDA